MVLGGVWRREAGQAPPEPEAEAKAEGAERAEGQRFGLFHSLRDLVRWKGN